MSRKILDSSKGGGNNVQGLGYNAETEDSDSETEVEARM
jgi:hypothetical protein